MKWAAGLLVVRVQPGGWRRAIVLPLPLSVFEDALEAMASLLRLGLWLGWKPLRRRSRSVRFQDDVVPRLARMLALSVRELKAHGPFVLAEVEGGGAHVSVRVL